MADILHYAIPPEENPDIFYPEMDDKPRFQSFRESDIVHETSYVLNYNGVFSHDAPDILFSVRSYIYYEMNNPQARVAPDFYVTFSVDAAAIVADSAFKTWRVGKAPDFVLEVATPPGQHFFPPLGPPENDLTVKRDLYARLGISEYWRLDPTVGAVVYGEALVGEELVAGKYTRLPINAEPGGMVRGHSPLLSLDLCWSLEERWTDSRLRFHNPARAEWLRNFAEHEILRRALESEVRELRKILSVEEPSGNGHHTGRYLVDAVESEQRRNAAEAELEELREELRRRQWPPQGE